MTAQPFWNNTRPRSFCLGTSALEKIGDADMLATVSKINASLWWSEGVGFERSRALQTNFGLRIRMVRWRVKVCLPRWSGVNGTPSSSHGNQGVNRAGSADAPLRRCHKRQRAGFFLLLKPGLFHQGLCTQWADPPSTPISQQAYRLGYFWGTHPKDVLKTKGKSRM